MIAALLATVLFAVSAVSARRSVAVLGATPALLARLFLATTLLGLYAHTLGAGFGGAGLRWFLLSGVIGMGFGDIALFEALPRLGSRLSVLIVHCVAAPLAAGVEWLWLGHAMTAREMLGGAAILGGVALALAPAGAVPAGWRAGVVFAVIAAAGQGLGAVFSRVANEAARAAEGPVDGLTAAYQRIVAGTAVTLLAFVWLQRRGLFAPGTPSEVPAARRARLRRAVPWVVANAVAGPTLGVGAFQWALVQRGTGVVLPIVALTPLVIVPLSLWLEGERPSARSLLGGVIAVAGTVALTWG
ncbi:MAG TPA: DMT family transporter [Verrucomicrobiota bacterium]|nr:DMT family transporter [Verrucomicrobiota bacterium]